MTKNEINKLTPGTELYFSKGCLYDGFVKCFGNPVHFVRCLGETDQFGKPLIVVIDKDNTERTLSSGYFQLTKE